MSTLPTWLRSGRVQLGLGIVALIIPSFTPLRAADSTSSGQTSAHTSPVPSMIDARSPRSA